MSFRGPLSPAFVGVGGLIDLARCYGGCRSIIQLFVDARVDVEYIERLMPFAADLLSSKAIEVSPLRS